MASYYESLGISPTASKAEIQQAIDSQYNQVRRLVNHYDASVVNKANQALLVLEQARAVLLDDVKRADYDASLGLGGPVVAGVADPNLAGQAAPYAPPPQPNVFASVSKPPVAAMAQPVAPLAAGWVCQHCGATSPMGTMFCTSCGKEVGRICPNCQAAYEARSRFCPSCGMPYETAARRAEINGRLTQLRTQKMSLESQAGATSSLDLRSIQYLWTIGGGWAFFLAGTAALYLLGAVFRLIFGFIPFETLSTPAMRGVTVVLGGVFTLARWALVGLSAAFFLVYLEKRRGIRADRVALAGFGVLMLLAMLFGGSPMQLQLSYFQRSAWLIFPALMAGGLFLWGGWTLAKQNAATQALAIPAGALSRYQGYLNTAFSYSQTKPWLLAGGGAALAFAVLIFSMGPALLSIIVGVVALASALLLGVVAYRAWTLQDIQVSQFESQRSQAQAALAQVNAEIGQLEMEMSALPVGNARR